jgi:hypothetical protein
MAEQPTPPAPEQKNPEVEHEHTDVNVRGILTFAAVMVVAGLVVHVVLWFLQSYFVAREKGETPPLPSPAADERLRLPQDVRKLPDPRLQISDVHDLDELRRKEEKRLDSYGWVDRKAGVVHIPIDRALEEMANPEQAAAAGLLTREQKKPERGKEK